MLVYRSLLGRVGRLLHVERLLTSPRQPDRRDLSRACTQRRDNGVGGHSCPAGTRVPGGKKI